MPDPAGPAGSDCHGGLSPVQPPPGP